MEKKEKKKVTKKKQSKKGLIQRIETLNRGELKTKSQRKTKYQICAEFIIKNSGKYSKAEIVDILEKESWEFPQIILSTISKPNA